MKTYVQKMIKTKLQFLCEKTASPQILRDQLYLILKVSISLCFIGHGVWGLFRKQEWISYFNVVGIPDSWAMILMPAIGTVDIILGVLILVHPNRGILFYMAAWAFWTALLRPLANQSFWEVWERAGNYFPPILFLILMGTFKFSLTDWLSKLRKKQIQITEDRIKITEILLRISLFLLLIGHAGFFVFDQKSLLSNHLSSLGLPDSSSFLIYFGIFEFVLAFICLISTSTYFFLVVLIWKVFSEILYPIAGSLVDTFEFIERFGDYGIPLAIICTLRWRKATNVNLIQMTRKKIYALRIVTYSGLCGAIILCLWPTIIYSPESFSTQELLNTFNGESSYFTQKAKGNIPFKPSSFRLLSGKKLMTKLKEGGNIIFFRHFSTDYRKIYHDKTRIRHETITAEELLKSCNKQRHLSPYGRMEAQSVAYGIKTLNIPIGEILTSPYCRNIESTRLAFSKDYTVQRDLIYRAVGFTKTLMNQYMFKEISKPFVKNKVIVSHRTQMDDVAHINEGEAFVLDVLSKGRFNLIGIVQPEEWVLAIFNPEALGLGRIQKNLFSKKVNSHVVARDTKEFNELLKRKLSSQGE